MVGSRFTNEEIQYLRSLPAVVHVSNGRIEYSDAFKRQCVVRYAQGDSPVRMFREAGLDPSLIGYKRIERCIARWKATPWLTEPQPQVADAVARFDAAGAERPGGNDDAGAVGHGADEGSRFALTTPLFRQRTRGGRSRKSDMRDLLIAQQINYIADLEKEIELLKSRLDTVVMPVEKSTLTPDGHPLAGRAADNGRNTPVQRGIQKISASVV